MVKYPPNVSLEYGRRLAKCEEEERVVISGISGVYPNCENVSELAEALFKGKDLITDNTELNFSAGKVKNVGKFDAQFFGITQEHADYMDPLCRILLEKTYEAITDSGYNINHFRGTTVGVYVANCTSDAEIESTYRTDIKGALICERAQSFLANRISYWLGITGPSCTVNTACSSSLYALELAYKAIRNGECDAALVGGSNLSLAPGMINLYKNLGITSARCRSFDNAANGFCRSEAISVILLQKSKYARRVYAQVVHVKTNNDGFKKQTILFPSSTMQTKLINEVYEECGIPRSSISWVEAHGTGTRIGDYQEMKSLETLCQGRDSPLLCGCVKSTIGHTEASSGLCSIAKVIVAMERGLIPPNINFSEPQSGIKALHENKIKVIVDTTPWSGGYVAVNNFGIGGSNAHLLLKSNPVKRNFTSQFFDKLFLVVISGRTAESVKFIIEFLNSNPLDVELVNLLHQVYNTAIPRHPYRGYTIINEDFTLLTQHVQRITEDIRPIWFIYPGLGSQWSTMAKELLKLECFKNSIQECHSILQPKDINLMEILTKDDPEIFQNILHCFMGITAMMIALTDLLEAIGIKPEGLIGHSFGEIGCAYADKCLSKKQALMVAYYRGITSMEMGTVKGSMAVVGLGCENTKKRCPSPIDIVCHNGTRSCTIAGPTDAVRELVDELNHEQVFAVEVFSSNIAYHSRYIKQGGPIYEKYLQRVIKTPRERSRKWISTLLNEEESDINLAKYCSAEYFVNNFLQPVQFEKALQRIPNNAITIEIAPHSILSHAINETLDENVANIALLNKKTSNPLQHLLISLGSLYEHNINMDISKLYSSMEYPVSRGTPMIGPLIKWNHEEDWHIPFHDLNPEVKNSSIGKPFIVDYKTEKYLYLKNHVINGANVFPESGFLKMAWEAFSEQKIIENSTSVIFSNIHFRKQVLVPSKGSLNFNAIVTRVDGYFEVVLDNEVVCNGYIETLPDEFDASQQIDNASSQEEAFVLQSEDIYKEFRVKGYDYTDHFQTIRCCNLEGTSGKIKWTRDWTVYMDALFQFLYFFKTDKSYIEIVSKIDTIKIEVRKQHAFGRKFDNEIPVSLTEENILSGGVSIKGVITRVIERGKCEDPILQQFQFVPYFDKEVLSLKKVVRMMITIVLENIMTSTLKVLEYETQDNSIPVLSTEIDEYFQVMSFFKIDVTIHKGDQKQDSLKLPSHFKVINGSLEDYSSIHVFIMPNLAKNTQIITRALSTLKDGAFIVTREIDKNELPSISGLKISATYDIGDERLILWHKVSNYKIPLVLRINEDSFSWVPNLQQLLHKNSARNIVIYSEYTPHSGILGFYKCIKKEATGNNLRCFLILDNSAPSFSITSPFYENQLRADLAINVYKGGAWGVFVPFEIDPIPKLFVPHVQLDIYDNNDEEKLHWVQGEIKYNMQSEGSHHQLIRIHYATLPDNYTDSVARTEDHITPYEFSGENTHGTNFAGISLTGRISNFVSEKECIFWDLPVDYSLQDAVTFPIAYLTALMIFLEIDKRNLKTILIQNGRTEIGQAAIHLFLKYRYTILTVEETKSQKECIQNLFPKVQSQDVDGLSQIDDKVDILLLTDFSTTVSDLINRTTHSGYIFYTGNEEYLKLPIIENAILEGKHFQAINLTKIINQDPDKLFILRETLNNELKSGAVRPLKRTKVDVPLPGILPMAPKDTKIQLIFPQDKATYEVEPKFTCSSKHVYIICGGLGGMGFELADWVVQRGAKKLFLVSRTGKYNGYQLRKIAQWQSMGIFIKITTDNIATYDGVANLLKSANQVGTVSAIFNTTLILHDGLFENLTEDNFQIVADPKAMATIHLDNISRIMCPDLQHFVAFSSIGCGYGNAGQSNYGYANSVIERICELRVSQGLPGLAIEWAGVGDVGYLKNTSAHKLPGGTLLQPIRSCLQTLEKFLCQSKPVVSSFVISKDQVSKESKYDTAFTKIMKILENSNVEILSDTTLRDIGLDSITVTETKIILEQKYNLIMKTNDILHLKLKELWQIEGNRERSGSEIQSFQNLSILEKMYMHTFSLISSVDITQLSPIIRLESYLHEGKTHHVEVDEEPTIFFLPSIEGFASVMQPLAKNVDLQVLCANYGTHDYDVKTIAKKLLEEIENRLTSSDEFHILGYSFGGLVALEIAYALEQKGKTGYLYILDSSPGIVKSIAMVLFKDREFYTNLLACMRALKTNIDMSKFQKQLLKIKDWESAVNFTIESIPGATEYEKQCVEILLRISYGRHESVHSYEAIPKKSLKSKVYLFKAKESLFPMPASYGLSEFCEMPLEEYVVSGNHFTMLGTTELSHYIMTLYRQSRNTGIYSKH